jgi:hypothetical protein
VTAEQLASLANGLKDNEAFQQALAQQRSNALERLAIMDHGDTNAFYAAQAMVAVVDGINENLEQFIRSGAKKPKPGIA